VHDLEILIKTRTELAGAEAAVQTLERQIGAAKATGESYDALAAKRDRAQGAIADYQKSAIPPKIAAPTPLGSKIEFDAARGTVKSLESQIGVAKATGESYTVLEQKLNRVNAAIATYSTANPGGFLDGLNNQLRESIPGFARLETGLSAMTAGPLGYVAAGFVALGAAFKVAAAGVREYAEAEQGVVARDQALAQRGLLTDAYRESLSELADEMRKLTGIDDDRWTAAITRLTQFGANSGNMSASVEAVKNLAGIMKGDLQGASEAVSRALQGNFMMFSRLGIHISETGTKAEKLAELYKKLADIGGGQLEARTHTLAGQYDKLKVSIGEVTKGIGSQIAHTGIIQGALEFAGNAAEYLGDKMAAVIPQAVGLKNSTENSTQAIADQAEATKKATEEMDAYKTSMSNAAEEAKKLDEIKGQELSHADKMAEIEAKRKLSLVDVREKEGAITPVQAIAARAVISTDLEKGKFDRKQAEEARKLAADVARSKEVVGTFRTEGEAVTEQESRAKEVGEYEKAAARVAAGKSDLAAAEERLAVAKVREASGGSGVAALKGGIWAGIGTLPGMPGGKMPAKTVEEIQADIARTKQGIKQEEARLAGLTLPEGAESAASEAAKAARLSAAHEGHAPIVEKEVGTLGFEVTKRTMDIKNRAAEFGAETGADRTVTASKIRSQEVADQKNAPAERINTNAAQAILQRNNDELMALLANVIGGSAAQAAAIRQANAKLRAIEGDVNNLSGVVNRQRTP